MKLLQARKAGDASQNVVRAEKMALRAESSQEWHKARECWYITSYWYNLMKDDVQARRTKQLGAETYVKEAEAIIKQDCPNFTYAASRLQFAINAFRQVGDTKQRVQELHKILLEYQQKAVLQFIPSSSSIDVTDMVRQAVEYVKGKTLSEALQALSRLGHSADIKHLRAQAEENNKTYLLKRLFPAVILNARGRAVARQPEGEDEALRADMFQNASYHRSLHVQALVEPARYQIVSEHAVRVRDFIPFLADNPFVYPGREWIIARGLHAGINGDFLIAVHLLIPQLEASIRHILWQLQVITSGLDDEGIQLEYNLNKLLAASEYTKPLAELLGEDVVFDLRGLLVERFGANLRNDMAHGLIDQEGFYTEPASYLWWVSLNLYFSPAIARLREDTIDQTDGETKTA